MPKLQLPMRERKGSTIRELSIESKRAGAINLAQGFPDDAPPAEMLELLHRYSLDASVHQYAESRGVPALRNAIAEKLAASNGLKADPDQNIVVTCGATEAMMLAFQTLFEPDDEILVFCPVYENYFLQARAVGLKVVPVVLSEPDFAVSVEQLEEARTNRTRGLVVCNPCNPTGKVYGRDELEQIAGFAERHNLLILSDETYERFIWRGMHVSIGSLPAAADRTVSIFSMGKTYSITGWRIGYVTGPDECMHAIAARHDLTMAGVSHPCQMALTEALSLPESFYTRTMQGYAERKALLERALVEFGLKPWDAAGSYFLWCDYSELTDAVSDVFVQELMRQAGVTGVPGAIFYPQAYRHSRRIRFTFSKSLSTIRAAAAKLAASRQMVLAY